ncbi:phosphatidylinositol/phosphatidylcholine transfer protein SFH2 isoform X1 [Rhizophagus clarus]|nr:phosphatidylinositol/phosphatidylcholine transfer protein SFH2 isoform X1 [Rhizophagus clarus]
MQTESKFRFPSYIRSHKSITYRKNFLLALFLRFTSAPQGNNELNLENRDQIIKKFRDLLGKDNEKYDDHTLMRFATARSFQLDKAKEQLIDTIAWRDLEGIDSIPLPILNPGTPILYPVRGLEPIVPDINVEASNGVPENILRIYEYFGGNAVHKTDKEGRGIYIERLGYHDSKRLAKYVKQEELMNWHIRCQEFSHRVIMPELSKRAGKIIDKETVIFDCEGMGFHQLHLPGLTLYRTIAELDQKYYPERLANLFVVNAPFVFVKIWALAKKWLDPGMLKKVHICDKDFKKVLLEHIDAENIPSFLGGTCTCSHMPGGCVPSVILNNIPSLTSSLPLTPTSTRPSTPIPPESKKDGFNGRLRILKGDFRSCEVIVANNVEDNNISKNNVEMSFRVVEGKGEVKFGVKFIKADSNTRYEEKIIMSPTLLVGDDFIMTRKHAFQTDDTGEFIFTWYFDQWSESDSCVIENSIMVNGELYGDQ